MSSQCLATKEICEKYGCFRVEGCTPASPRGERTVTEVIDEAALILEEHSWILPRTGLIACTNCETLNPNGGERCRRCGYLLT